jgi:hypothetical protein
MLYLIAGILLTLARIFLKLLVACYLVIELRLTQMMVKTMKQKSSVLLFSQTFS